MADPLPPTAEDLRKLQEALKKSQDDSATLKGAYDDLVRRFSELEKKAEKKASTPASSPAAAETRR